MRINHIVPASLQEAYTMERLKESGHPFLYNEDILSFDVFCRRLVQDEMNDGVHLLKTGRKLDELKDQFSLYGPMIQYPAFIDQVASFEKELAKAKVNLNDLNPNNELTKILMSLDDYSSLTAKEEKLDELLQKEKGNFVLLSSNDIFSYGRLKRLIENGNREIERKKCTVKQRKLMKAVNIANECEGVIQDILARHIDLKDVLVIMTDYPTQMPVFMDLAAQYQLPVSGLGLNESSKAVRFFISLIHLYLNHSVDNLCTALSNECFCIGLSDEMKCYLDSFITTADELFEPFNYVEKYADETDLSTFDKNNYLRIEQAAEVERKLIESELATLFGFESALDVLSYIYELITTKVFLSQEETAVLMEIKKDIEDCADYLFSISDLTRFEYDLNKKTKRMKTHVGGLQVTDMIHPAGPHQLVYILGCSADNYPGFKPLKGIFDESYVENTSFPTLAQRVEFRNQQIAWIHTSGEEIIYSYCCSDYSGKGKELAYGIEQIFGDMKAILWPVVYHESRSYLAHHLSEQMAENLFSRDHLIYGSISSFERFFYCPYSYFLKSGLKLNKVEMHGLDAALIGTIQHAIMEHLVDENPKNYGKIKESRLREEVAGHFAGLKKMFVKNVGVIDMIEKRMADSLVLVFEFLADMEEKTLYQCVCQEKDFNVIFATYQDYSVKLKGIIDRYDTSGSSLRIVDYKSSTKKLEASHVDAGIQLQLLSYLIVATRLLSVRPMGAYYFSLKLDNINMTAAKLDGRSGQITEYTKEDFYPDFVDSEKLNGWTFDEDVKGLDFDGNHVTGIACKNGEVSLKKKMDYTQIENVIMQVYAKLIEGLLAGNTAIKPVTGACKFCDFKSVCRFKGDEEKLAPVIEEPLSKKKEDADEVE